MTASTEVNYISIDPGHTSGVCGYDKNCNLVFMLTVDKDNIVGFLEDEVNTGHVHTVIYEEYAVFPNKAQQHVYNPLHTVRVIGAIQSWALRKKLHIHGQKSSIKPTAYRMLGVKPLPKSDPQNHSLDAHAHFTFWAVKNKKLDPRKLIK